MSDLGQKFDLLYQQWYNDTMMISNMTTILLHPSHLRIIGMGKDALPFILQKMADDPGSGHWFSALDAIVDDSPKELDEAHNDGRKMRDIWVKWGKERGYITN